MTAAELAERAAAETVALEVLRGEAAPIDAVVERANEMRTYLHTALLAAWVVALWLAILCGVVLGYAASMAPGTGETIDIERAIDREGPGFGWIER